MTAGDDVFVGREWAYERVASWLRDGQSPVLVITGGAGVGKTAFARHLVARGVPRIDAFAFCSARTDMSLGNSIVANLSDQLAVAVPGYRERFIELNEPTKVIVFTGNQRVDVAPGAHATVTNIATTLRLTSGFQPDTYARVVRRPIAALADRGELPPGGITLLIDGLDEATDDQDEYTFAEVLIDALADPVPGLRLIIASRLTRHTQHLDAFPHIDLVADQPAGTDDVARYVELALRTVTEPAAAALSVPARTAWVALIAAESHGNFLLARAAVEQAVALVRRVGDAPPPAGITLPTLVADAWRDRLRRLGSAQAWTRRYGPVLGLLAQGLGADGLPYPVLRAAATIREPSLGQATLDRTLGDVEPFRTRSTQLHLSLREYLTAAPGEHYTYPDACHLAIATALANQWRRRWAACTDDYARRYLLRHLAAAVGEDRPAVELAAELARDLPYVQSCVAHVGVTRFLGDLERLSLALHGQAPEVDELATILNGQTDQLRAWEPDLDPGRLAQQLLHEARTRGLDSLAEALDAHLDDGLPPTFRTAWATARPARQTRAQIVRGGTSTLNGVALIDDASAVLVGEDGTAKILDIDRRKIVRLLTHDGVALRAVAVSRGRVLTGSVAGRLIVWDGETGGRRHVLPGHAGAVTSIAVAADTDLALTTGIDGTARLWDISAGVSLGLLDVEGPDGEGRAGERVLVAAIVPSGEIAVTGSTDGSVRVWRLPGGGCQSHVREHTEPVRALALTPDGKHAVTGDDGGTVRLWRLDADPATAAVLPTTWGLDTPLALDPAITSVAISPDARHVVAASRDRHVRVWDVRSTNNHLLAHPAPVSHVVLAPDRRHVLTIADDDVVRIWNLDSGGLVRTLAGHTGRISAVAPTPHGRRAVTTSWDRTARIWPLWTNAATAIPGHGSELRGLATTVDGRVVSVARDGSLAVWGIDTGTRLAHRRAAGPVTAMCLAGGDAYVILGTEDGTVTACALGGDETVRRLPRHHSTVTVALATVDGHVLTASRDAVVRLVSLADGRRRHEWHLDRGVTAAALARIGTSPVAVVATEDHRVRVIDLATGASRYAISGNELRVAAIAVTEDGRRFVTGSWDATARVYDVASGRAERVLAGHRDAVNGLACHQGRVLTVSEDGRAIVWSLVDGRRVHVLREDVAPINVATFSADGRAVTGSDGTLRLWATGPLAGAELGRPVARLSVDAALTHLAAVPGDRAGFIAGTRGGDVMRIQLPAPH
jgi:WD40 repeat protein